MSEIDDLCDVCHHPESDSEGVFVFGIGWLQFGDRATFVQAHRGCWKYVRIPTDEQLAETREAAEGKR